MKITLKEFLIKALEMNLETVEQEIEIQDQKFNETLSSFAAALRTSVTTLQCDDRVYWHEIPSPKSIRQQHIKLNDILGKDSVPGLEEKKEGWRSAWEKYMSKKLPVIEGETSEARLARGRIKIEEDWFKAFCKSDTKFAALVGAVPYITDDFTVTFQTGSWPEEYWMKYKK